MKKLQIAASVILVIACVAFYTSYLKSKAVIYEEKLKHQQQIALETPYIPYGENAFKLCDQPSKGDLLAKSLYKCIRKLEDEIIKLKENNGTTD